MLIVAQGNSISKRHFSRLPMLLIYSSGPTQMPTATSGASTGRSNSRKPPQLKSQRSNKRARRCPVKEATLMLGGGESHGESAGILGVLLGGPSPPPERAL